MRRIVLNANILHVVNVTKRTPTSGNSQPEALDPACRNKPTDLVTNRYEPRPCNGGNPDRAGGFPTPYTRSIFGDRAQGKSQKGRVRLGGDEGDIYRMQDSG